MRFRRTALNKAPSSGDYVKSESKGLVFPIPRWHQLLLSCQSLDYQCLTHQHVRYGSLDGGSQIDVKLSQMWGAVVVVHPGTPPRIVFLRKVFWPKGGGSLYCVKYFWAEMLLRNWSEIGSTSTKPYVIGGKFVTPSSGYPGAWVLNLRFFKICQAKGPAGPSPAGWAR